MPINSIYAQGGGGDLIPPVGGVLEPVNEVALYGELAKQYSMWLIPVIGIGGIMSYEDALEFIICGASAIQVGTATFVNPRASAEIIKGIEGFLKKNRIKDIKDLIGTLKA